MITRLAHILARICALLLLLALPVGASVAHAQGMEALKDKLFGNKTQDGRTQQAPKVARFTSEDGDSFVFDQSHSTALIRFDGDDEVWSLTPSPGPKGDVIYKNDVGEPVIKTTRWGGMILFTADRPTGDPAALTGKAQPFQTQKINPAQLWLNMAKSARRASLAVERLITFDAPDVSPETAALYDDAFNVASDAIVEAAGIQSRTRRALDGVREVQFIEGRPPSATVVNGALVLKLDSSRGTWGGRPSSRRIFNVLITTFQVADERH